MQPATRESALQKLLSFAFQPAFDSDHTIAETIFWGDFLKKAAPHELQWLMDSQDATVKYNSWFLFDWDADGQGTVAELFLEDEAAALTRAEQEFVTRLLEAPLRLYEVEAVERGEGVHLRDLWNDSRLFVVEHKASMEIVSWDLLGARVAPDGYDGFVFEGGLYLYPADIKTALLSWFRRLHRQYHRKHPTADSNAFFRRHGAVFHHIWLDFVAFPAPPQVVTSEGDPLVFCRAVFDCEEADAVRARLIGHPDIIPVGDGLLQWVERTPDGDLQLGVWEIDGRRIELETTSQERAERGREWLEQLVGSLVRYRATGMETLAQAMDDIRQHGHALPPEPPEDPTLVRELFDRHYTAWLDLPVPALGNRTPRAAARTKVWRARLIDLLKQFENGAERAGLQGRPGYDFRWMWRELGIDRPEIS